MYQQQNLFNSYSDHNFFLKHNEHVLWVLTSISASVLLVQQLKTEARWRKYEKVKGACSDYLPKL